MSIARSNHRKFDQYPAIPNPLERISKKIFFGPEREIFGEGMTSFSWYKISSGIVRLTKITQDGRRCVPEILFASDCFGLDKGIERPVGAESVTPVVLYEFDIATTERLAQSNAEISAFLLEMLSQRAAAREEHTLFLSCLSAIERLAGFLLSLWERSGRRARVKVPIGRGDVADYLGMRPETLSRSLSRLRSMQVVECISPDEIMILSPLRLKAVVGQGRRLQASGSQAQHTDTMAED